MPRAPRSSSSPSLSPEAQILWSDILDRAEAFHEMAPWQWIAGGSILGVRDPISVQIDWCSILGQNGETYGVAMYPGEAGFASLHEMCETGPDEFDAVLQQVARVMTFSDRGGITRDMMAILKASERRYRGANAWPELLIHDPGYFPMPPRDETTLRRTRFTLDCLLVMCMAAQRQPGWDREDDKGRPWVATLDSAGQITMERQPYPQPAVLTSPIVPLDDIAIARVLKAGARLAGPLVVDWFPGTAVIDGPDADGRPYYVLHVVILDPRTGMVLDVGISRLTTVWPDVVRSVLKSAAHLGVPQEISVRRPEAVDILRPLAERLGCAVVHRPDVAPIIQELRDGLMRFLG